MAHGSRSHTLTEYLSNVRPQSMQLNALAEQPYVWFCTLGCIQYQDLSIVSISKNSMQKWKHAVTESLTFLSDSPQSAPHTAHVSTSNPRILPILEAEIAKERP